MKKIKSISKYFFNTYHFFLLKLKNSYFKSNLYNRKISDSSDFKFNYKPSLYIINSLALSNKNKIKIESFSLNSVWQLSSKKKLEFENLHNFLWLSSLDLKTTKSSVQSIIENWIDINYNFNEETWKLIILSKRIIAWISNSNLTLDESNPKYKKKIFSNIIKQANHLYKNINSLEDGENKLICLSSLILVGLTFKNQNKYFELGLASLQKLKKNYFYNSGFPKSRNPEELMLSLKYLILIKEWIKESQNLIPDYLEELIYKCGNSYNFISKDYSKLPLFNGSSELKNEEFQKYLKQLNYNFTDTSKEKCGFVLFKNRKIIFIMDVGESPEFKFSEKYQSGCLSFEITSNDEKIICNSGFDKNNDYKLKLLSKATAAQSTLYLNDNSSCTFNKKYNLQLYDGLKIIDKKIIFEKDFEVITASHDGYKKRFDYIHQRSVKFIKKDKIFVGTDSLIKGEKNYNIPFAIRFHMNPNIKIIKTQGSHSVLISLNNGEGWKFKTENRELSIEKGIYLGTKNRIINNENILISGMTNGENQTIGWSLEKIS